MCIFVKGFCGLPIYNQAFEDLKHFARFILAASNSTAANLAMLKMM